jgi:transposase-like protein
MSTTQNNSNKQIKKLPVFEDEKDLLQFLERSLTDNLKQFIRVSITTLVKAEMEQLRTSLQDQPYFNGYYNRQLVSPFGRIEDIPIPRFRDGFGDQPPTVLAGFEDEKARTWQLLRDMHLLGISQRKVKHLAQKHLGINISLNAVKEATHELVMHESAQINNKLLDDEFEYLFMDGIWEKVKGNGWDNTKAVVLCVLGMKADGTRELIGFTLARAEDENSWVELLSDIKRRGLIGNTLNLVVMDDSAGAKAAIDRIYPNVPIQNCLVHKLRNVQSKTSYQHRAAVTEDLKAITNANSPDEATAAAKAIVKKWYVQEEKAMNSLKHNFEYCLTYFQFPRDKWASIRSTNILEREFREVRRRTKVNDHSFNDFDSARRYHEGIFQYLNANYPARSQYKEVAMN